MAAAAEQKLKIAGGTDGGDEELRLWLEGYLAEHSNVTTAELSRSDHIGGSKTALDAYLKGTYFLPKEVGGMGVNPENSNLEAKIRSYRDKREGTVRHGYKNSFLATRSWGQFQHACKTAIDENVIVIVYAKPGVGKSRCMLEYSSSRVSTLPIEILCSANITTRYFVQKIARELSLSDVPPTARLEDMIADKLKKNPRPLFVDQANYLNEKALGTICYLWEKARIPIVLLGTHDLKELFTRSRLTEDVRVQLSSRIAMHYPLMELSIEEVKSIVANVLGDRATGTVIKNIWDATHGNHRHLDMIMPRLSQLVDRNIDGLDDPNNKDVTMEKLIDTATSRLMVG
jgi:DNA transposition AAA+ family ATPase